MRPASAIVGVATALLLLVPAPGSTANPEAGSLRLQPLLPGGGGRVTAGTLELEFTVGQAVTERADASDTQLRSGFWTPVEGSDGSRIFADGFEEATP